MESCCIVQGAQPGAWWQPRGVGGRIKRKIIRVSSWLVHVIVWQKPTQHSKAISLQLEMNFKRNMDVHHPLALSPESRETWSQRIILFVVLFIVSLSAWEFLYHSFPYKVLSCIPQLQTEQEIISAGNETNEQVSWLLTCWPSCSFPRHCSWDWK